MKFNIKKQFITLLGLVALQQTNAQVIFKEDFGTVTGTERRSSPYVPQTGKDTGLNKFDHGTAFYKFAQYFTGTGLSTGQTQSNQVHDGHYAILKPYGNTTLPNWFPTNVYDHTIGNTGAKNGGLMVVNCGGTFNQYYRRAVSLTSGKTYKLSIWIFNIAAGNGAHKFKMEAQNILTETVLGSSGVQTATTTGSWVQYSFKFKVPDSASCNSDVAVSFRNQSTVTSGNDIYIDDISLEEIPDENLTPIDCNNDPSTMDSIIKANDDAITTTLLGGTYSILTNDSQSNAVGTVVVSGTGVNASIVPVGTWPVGYSIDATGKLVVAPGAVPLTQPLQYQITNLLGVSSIANITITYDSGTPIKGNADVYNWQTGSGTKTYPSVIINDSYNNGAAGQGFVLTGTGKNTTISQKGTWPTGITLDPNTGVITATSNASKPTTPIYYTICNMAGVCEDVAVTFLGVEGVFNPGTISLSTPIVCFDGSATVTSTSKANSGPLDLYAYSYDWQFSYNNGVTWTNVGDAAEGSDGSTGDFGEFNVDGSNSITVGSLKKPILIRRKAKRWSIPQVNAFTAPVLITPQTENIIIFPNNINAFTVEQGGSFTFPTFTSTHASTYTITDTSGNTVANTLTNLQKGEYYFTIKATTTSGVTGCVSYATIQLIVYDLADCNISVKKHYATHKQSWTSGLSGVANPEKAVNGDRSQYATITGGVVILGIGTVGIDLYFTKPDGTLYTGAELKGKKVTVKLGEQYSGLKLAGGVTIVGRKINSLSDISGTVPPLANVGKTFGVKGGVLDLLKGDNVFEFSFTPTNNSGATIDYNGIRVQLGSLLGVADLATVFHAFVEEEITVDPLNNPCTNGGIITVTPAASLVYPTTQKGHTVSNNPITLNQFAEDATWGNYTEVLNVATGLSSVTFPYYAIDNNYNSYAIFNTTAGVLNKQFLNARLRQKARPGDQVQITLGTENVNVLNLGLLNLIDYKIKYYLGDTKVGEQTLDRFKVLDLGLLNFSNEQKVVISTPITVPFDRVQLEQWNTVNVNLGNQLYIYDIRVNPQMLFEGQVDTKNKVTLCAADFLGIQKMDLCTTYEVSFAKVIEYGDQLRDEKGKLMVDEQGNPVLSIKAVADITNSQLAFSHSQNKVDYYEINKLYPEHGNDLLVKIQTKRQGCSYGDAQYLRVKLENCNDAIVNPVIKSGAKK
ncbi:hypothetical protein H1R17_12725 [Flavobacterium sp. xlx-214]|uniref:hypothetical protein n=1 Tax=unclassified Flavobacterium TaxID=196869 RepID=UPI0013D64F65|nr:MULTISPECIES: hypothetical protein [unclassified Flavobacterium]MBA5791545.1 hypothetical protein [Flavobacterium sp. xlx-221]QMI83305.1 hypothetical protein H1R17_12725 [Flavobacterium sp. xlx-214]